MSNYELSDGEQAEGLTATTEHHASVTSAAENLPPPCSSSEARLQTSAVRVVVICLPCDSAWHGDELARRLANRLRGIDCAEALRTLSEQFESFPDTRKSPMIGGAISQHRGAFETNLPMRLGDSRYQCAEDNRSLVTLLFTDIVGSTRIVEQLGDSEWRVLLARHNTIVRSQLRLFDGKEVDNAGDGFLAIFDRPTRAVRCAECARAELQTIGIEIRAAIHTGECEAADEFVSGVAVHVAARIASVAQPGEILVSSTVRDLVAGSGLEFSDGEWHTLRGLSGSRQLFALKERS